MLYNYTVHHIWPTFLCYRLLCKNPRFSDRIKSKKFAVIRARICKRLWSPGIDSEETIPPAYVAWRAGTTNRVVVPARQDENRFLGSLKGLQIRAQACAEVGEERSLQEVRHQDPDGGNCRTAPL
jgi:hypothetical protein